MESGGGGASAVRENQPRLEDVELLPSRDGQKILVSRGLSMRLDSQIPNQMGNMLSGLHLQKLFFSVEKL